MVKVLSENVARKIAAGEVIDRPNAIVRELMDNAVDSGADKIKVEITQGGIEKIRVSDNGCGMSKEDLMTCARPHATSKITSEEDLLKLATLGFRGEALCSMASVGVLDITSGGWKMTASLTQDHIMSQVPLTPGTIVQTTSLFADIPARRVFLKRPQSEGQMCRTTFEEKALPRPDISFSLYADGEEKLTLPAVKTLKERFVQAMEYFEGEDLFYEIKKSDPEKNWSFTLVIGEPSVSRSNRKDIFVYVNGRRIQEYALLQAIEYGCQGFFPNGTHPVACLFATVNPSMIDFNIHPAKREAKFKDLNGLHHGISTAVKEFFKQYTVSAILAQDKESEEKQKDLEFDTTHSSSKGQSLAIAAFDENQGYGTGDNYSNISSFGKTGFGKDLTKKMDTGFSNLRATGTSGYKSPKPEISTGFGNIASHEISSSKPESITSLFTKNTKPNYVEKIGTSNQDFHYVGLAMGTFIIAEKNNSLYIIDQHAAHERYIYNKLLEESGQRQDLLLPYSIQTESDDEDLYLESMSSQLEECGFTVKNAGNGKWEIHSVPLRWKGTQETLAKDLLDKRISPENLINPIAASTACRAAVMAGTVLDEETARWIAKIALELPDPHCPHGRPVYTTITREQLFALVKRI